MIKKENKYHQVNFQPVGWVSLSLSLSLSLFLFLLLLSFIIICLLLLYIFFFQLVWKKLQLPSAMVRNYEVYL